MQWKAVFITSFWILQGFFERKTPKLHKYLRLKRTEFLWERGNRQRGRGVTGSWSQVCLCIDVNWMDAEHPPWFFNSFLTHVNRVTKINRMTEIRVSRYLMVDIWLQQQLFARQGSYRVPLPWEWQVNHAANSSSEHLHISPASCIPKIFPVLEESNPTLSSWIENSPQVTNVCS